MDTARAVSPLSRRHDGAGNLPRRTGATARGQVKVKVTCGESPPSLAGTPDAALFAVLISLEPVYDL